MGKNVRFCFVILPVILGWVLVSCDQRPVLLKTKVETVTKELSADFVKIRGSETNLIRAAAQVYGNTGHLDLSVNKMDVRDGGIFESFQGNKYYYKTIKEGASFYASPAGPVDERTKKEIRAMQYFEGDLKDTFEKSKDLLILSFFGIHEPSSMAMLYPWTDVVSLLPPRLDFQSLEWYTRGYKSTGPALWAEKPFISLYGGWVEDISGPVPVKDKTKGVVVLTVLLDKVNSKYFKNEPENLLLLGHDLTLVVATPPARKALPLKVIEDVDYLKQMKSNSFASAAYQLSDPGQDEGIRRIAADITSGKTAFEEAVNGTTWVFFVGNVQETGFYTVGFLEK